MIHQPRACRLQHVTCYIIIRPPIHVWHVTLLVHLHAPNLVVGVNCYVMQCYILCARWAAEPEQEPPKMSKMFYNLTCCRRIALPPHHPFHFLFIHILCIPKCPDACSKLHFRIPPIMLSHLFSPFHLGTRQLLVHLL